MSKQESKPTTRERYIAAFGGARYVEREELDGLVRGLDETLGKTFDELQAEIAELREEVATLKAHSKACSRARGLPSPIAQRSWFARTLAWLGLRR
ncbi:MAG: hypothetical protein KF850_24325 [Labilithrix sp.]|nr:hypothetical protein [Labilithrix sp.]